MPKKRVLLVDDDPKVLRLLEATLRLKEHAVVKNEDIAGAVEAARIDPPDLVISDTRLGGRDGYELLRQIRALPGLGTVPFIFLSSRSESAELVRSLGLGPGSFLRKPFSIDELLRRTEGLLHPQEPSTEPAGVWTGEGGASSLSDLLSELSVQRTCGHLRVESAPNSSGATLVIDEGAIVDASWGLLRGLSVVFQLLTRPGGTYHLSPGVVLERTITAPTLRLLMEGHRLLDLGIVRRIDPTEPSAVAAWELQLTGATRPLPKAMPRQVSRPASRPPTPPTSHRVAPVPLREGRPAVEFLDGIANHLVDPDMTATQAVTSLSGLLDEEERGEGASPSEERELEAELLAAIADEIEEEPEPFATDGVFAVGDDDDEQMAEGEAVREEEDEEVPPEALISTEIEVEVSGEFDLPGGDRDDRGEVTVEVADEVAMDGDSDDEENEVGLSTADFAPGFIDEDVGAVAVGQAEEEDESAGIGSVWISQEVTAVQMVEDTLYQVPVLSRDSDADRPDVMGLYERLRAAAIADQAAADVQLSTRAGSVVASTVRDEERRASLAAFATQVITFASTDSHGTRFATLDAGDTHIVVIEIDEKRVFSCMFDRRPDVTRVLTALRPALRTRIRS